MLTPDNSVLYRSADGYRRAMEAYDELLSELALPFEAQWVMTRFGLTHVIASGPVGAPPISFWHGLNASAPTWVNQINAAASKYRVYAIDVLGSMGKSSPTRLDRAGEDYGEWTVEVLSALELERAHMVGISNGAWLILKLAELAPHMIASAMLLSPAGFTGFQWQLVFKMLPGFFMSRRRRGAHFLKVMGAPGIPPAKQDVVMFDILMQDFRYEQAPGRLPDPRLGRLTAPTYVLVGEHEAGFKPSGIIKRAQATLPNLWKAEVLARVGHGMITEDPRAVNDRLLAFVGAQLPNEC
jgi:pimeloyl-ACP methyl ester carboxylesterase